MIHFQETMVWIAGRQEFRLNGLFTVFDRTNMVPVVMTKTKPMAISHERLGAVVDTATRSANGDTVDDNDM
jgi:hypothetical protein